MGRRLKKHSRIALVGTCAIALIAPAIGVADASVVSSRGVAPPDKTILGFTADGAKKQREYEQAFTDGVSARKIRKLSRKFSSEPQLIDTPGVRRTQQISVQKLRSWGLDVSTPSYSVYSSKARDIEIEMTAPYRRTLETKERGFGWQKNFDDVVEGYNAYSPAGDVSGQVVYANYGLPQDYAALEELGVSVEDKIVLVRYGGSFRGVKSQQAQVRGAKGVLIYSDPEDDGFVRGKVYPDGPWRPADGIQRGSVQYLFQYPGDPLTPGKPAVPGTRRISPEAAENLPRVPTTPISYGEAKPLLDNLEGPEGPKDFKGGLDSTYRVGPGGTEVHMKLDIDYEQMPVSNVLAEIRGTKRPEEKVILGAHYDGWTYGTSDDTSGWTSVMEVGRILGKLLDRGWRPNRTIVLAGWDGEEYGLLGSTEYVEQFQKDLRRDAVAYANLDGSGGTRFSVGGVPQLDDALIEATRAVRDPRTGKSAYDVWTEDGDKKPVVSRLGSGSDYTAFLDHVGVPSVQAGFGSPLSGGTYHSAYDDTYNMERYLDPGYLGHAGSSRMNGVIALRLANAKILPFHYTDYADAVAGYVENLEKVQQETPGASQLSLAMLTQAATRWGKASGELETTAEDLLASGQTDTRRGARAVKRMNKMLMKQERALITRKGLSDRPWFRHQIYAPGLVTGYAVQHLPGMRDAVERGDTKTARTYRNLLAQSLDEATQLAQRGADSYK